MTLRPACLRLTLLAALALTIGCDDGSGPVAALPQFSALGPPAASTGAVTNPTRLGDSTRLTFNGVANANGEETSVWFRYSRMPDLSDATQTPHVAIGAGTVNVSHAATVYFPFEDHIRIYYQLVAAQGPTGAVRTRGDIVSFDVGTPGTPLDLHAALTDTHTVHLTFDAPADPYAATSIRVLSRPSAAGQWSTLATLTAEARSFIDAKFPVYKDHREWAVQQCNAFGCSTYPIVALDGLFLPTPTGLHVTNSMPGQVTLAWNDNATEARYLIVRRTITGTLEKWYANKDVTTFTDATAQQGVQYYYTILAQAGGSTHRRSEPSDSVSVVPGASPAQPPLATTGAVTNAVKVQDSAKLTLNGVANANGDQTSVWFRYSRMPDLSDATQTPHVPIGGGTTNVAHAATIAFPFEDHVRIYYQLVAAQGPTGAVRTRGEILAFDYGTPTAPTNLQAMLTDTHTVHLTFDASAAPYGVTSIRVRSRPNAAGQWSTLATLPSDARSFIDAKFPVYKDHREWAVEQCNSIGCTASTVVALDGLILPTPAGFHVTNTTVGSVTFAWTDNATEARYLVVRRTVTGTLEKWYANKDVTTFTDATAQQGVQYYYTILAQAGGSTHRRSEPSDSVAVVPN